MNIVVIVTVALTVLLASVLIDRILNPFLIRRRIKKFMKDQTHHDPRSNEKPEEGMVYEDTIGLKIRSPKGNTGAIKWDEIEEVHAFKRDLFSIDLICLSFKKMDKEEYYEINEDMVGYHDLLEILPRRLLGYNPDWFREVAYPAFKANHQIVWKRSLEKTTHSVTSPIPQNS